MAKLTLSSIGSRYGSIDALNANFDAIEVALENTLSRDGATPNSMEANLDLNSKRIINLADGTDNTDAVTLRQVTSIIQGAADGLVATVKERATATAGQTVFNLGSITYTPGSNNLSVYIDGVRQYPGESYTETSSSRVTFASGLNVGAEVLFISNESITSTTADASNVTYTPAGTGAVATTVQAKLRKSVSVYDFMSAADIAAVRAGTLADASPFIQTAIDSIDKSIGGELFIGEGLWKIGTGINVMGHSNLILQGAGQGTTTLVGTVGVMVQPPMIGVSTTTWGILSIDALAADSAAATNILVQDLTSHLIGGTPGSYAADVANGTYYIKNIYFGWTDQIQFNRVTIEGSRWEALEHEGPVGKGTLNCKVTNCTFNNTQHNGFNLNTGEARGLILTDNYFFNCAFAVQVVGRGMVIANNVVDSCKQGFLVAEALYPNATADQESIIVSNNVVTRLGINTTTTLNVYGFSINAGDSQFTDGSVDNGIVISNNLVHNSVKTATNNGPLTAFLLNGGNLKVSGNHVTGLKKLGGSGDCVAFAMSSGVANGAIKSQCYFNNNTVDELLNTTPAFGYDWNFGISIGGKTGFDYYLSDNVITGVNSGFALYVAPVSGEPNVYLNGDILNGYIYYPSPAKWGLVSGSYLNTGGYLNNMPLFGTSTGTITTPTSQSVILGELAVNSATPSVAGFNVWTTANTSPTTITNFVGGVTGQTITLLFTDANTTLTDGANLKLSAAFTSTADDTMTLFYNGTAWFEMSRSVN